MASIRKRGKKWLAEVRLKSGYTAKSLDNSRWNRSGVWARVFKTLSEEADNEYAMIDSTIVRAH